MSNSKPQVENIPMELLYPLFADMLKGGSVTFTVTGISMQPMLYNRFRHDSSAAEAFKKR